ncbi:segregation and condensation protein A [Pleomorphochaeta sp. DL1XJH-081]|jgi:segregation and condensation protein A|uniref:segregation and condensation protein A n=1 Tax=Pleomorphochaeta sp. DL1XJH-081 TaxID=3409690 RepID=UPI003BB54861
MVKEAGLVGQGDRHPSTLSYSIRQFEGPLDLLLHLIQKAQVNIYDIPIAEITDQFLAYLDMASKLDLDDLTDFYAMAAHLIYLKSKMLLPNDDGFDEDDEFSEMRTELVERLLEYQKFKRYTALLVDSNQSGDLFIQRKKSQFMLPFEDQALWNDINVWDLLKTFSSLLRSITPQQVFNVYEEVTTKQKLSLMVELFEQREEISFLDLVVHRESPMDVICAFLAILEAVKFSMISIHQHALFGDIVIRKKDGFDSETFEDEDYGDEEPFESFIQQTSQIQPDVRMEHRNTLYDEDDDDEIIDLTDDAEGDL